jgi:hypothetical protein
MLEQMAQLYKIFHTLYSQPLGMGIAVSSVSVTIFLGNWGGNSDVMCNAGFVIRAVSSV